MHSFFRGRVEVVPETDCWGWALRKDRAGYGRASYQGKKGLAAHRLSYELHVGPITEGMTVDHLCFNTSCTNPSHLQLLSHSSNARRQRSSFMTHCSYGHPFDEANTYFKPDKKNQGRRQCRKCNADAVRRYKQRKAAS